MLGLTSLEVYSSICNITEEKHKFELYTDFSDVFLTEELKDELEEIPNFSDITPYYLQQEKIGPLIIQTFRKPRLEKPSTDGYNILLFGLCSITISR